MSSRIVMKLFDEDKISDEIVGSILFNLKECINEKVMIQILSQSDFRMANSFGRISMGLLWAVRERTPIK